MTTPPVPPLERVRSLLAGINAHGCRTQVDSDLASILQDYLRRVEADEWLEWQPIETAPRDGTMVMCWNGRDRCFDKWKNGKWEMAQVLNDFYNDDEDPPMVHTHWRPLPPPPEAASTALEGEK